MKARKNFLTHGLSSALPIPSTLGKREIDYETVFDRAGILLERLGNPHKKLPPVIHVAGTNGKGSAASLLAEIFKQAGYKAHIYTSPHLHECNERIVLDGEKISDNFLLLVSSIKYTIFWISIISLGNFLVFVL